MRQQPAPKMDGGGFVYAGESCDEMIFKCLDRSFCWILSVEVGRNELETFSNSHEFLQDCWALVVKVVNFCASPRLERRLWIAV